MKVHEPTGALAPVYIDTNMLVYGKYIPDVGKHASQGLYTREPVCLL